MTVRPSLVLLSFFLLAALPSVGQVQAVPQTPPAVSVASLANGEDLKNELLRIQLELKQISQDMDAIDAQMMLGIGSKALSGPSATIAKIHELLSRHNTVGTLKDFMDSLLSATRWELCLKTSRLYTSLFEKVLEMIRDRPSAGSGAPRVSSLADESPEVVQILFLTRMMTELEFRYAELQFCLAASPDGKQQDLWRKLREALQNDDRVYTEKLSRLLIQTGMSPNDFAAKGVSNAQKTSATAAAAVVEGMGISNLWEDTWKLADIPGINPDFVRALDCDRRTMKDFLKTGSISVFVQTCSCRKGSNGAYILAFAESRPDQAKSIGEAGKTQPDSRGVPPIPEVFRMSEEDLTRAILSAKKGDTKPGADRPPGESPGAGFSYSARPQPKIPSWWIRCECPDDHPDAGIVVDGVRWHAPVLHCPDPEVKRWQVK